MNRQPSPVVKNSSDGQMVYEEIILQTGKMSAQLGDWVCVVLLRGTIFLFSKLEILPSCVQVTGISKDLQELDMLVS